MALIYVNPGQQAAEKTYHYYGGLKPKCDEDVIVLGRCFKDWGREFDRPVVWIVHKPGNDTEAKRGFAKKVDLVLHSVPKLDYGDILFPYAADKVYCENELWYKDRIYDFGFSGALHKWHDPIRDKVQEIVRKENFRSFLNGSDEMKPRISDYQEYRKRICQSKVWMATTGPDGDVGPRYYEVMASRTLLFCNRVPNEYRHIFVDGNNCVEFTEGTAIDKLEYYLKNDSERMAIVENAYKDFILKHTWKQRAEDLCSIIKNMLHTKIT